MSFAKGRARQDVLSQRYRDLQSASKTLESYSLRRRGGGGGGSMFNKDEEEEDVDGGDM